MTTAYPVSGLELCQWVSVEESLFYDCNTGGPRSRTRNEVIHSTLLGDVSRFGHWETATRVALRFPPNVSPRTWCYEQLSLQGFASPEEARQALDVPQTVLACRTIEPLDPAIQRPVHGLPAGEALRSALILGSCSAHCYDPERPVIWTNRALLRPVFLYRVGDFYSE